MTRQSKNTPGPIRLLSVFAAAALLAGGCARNAKTDSAAATGVAAAAPSRTIRIGYQKGTILQVLRLQGVLEKSFAASGVKLQWLDFPAGPQTLEALRTGNVDFSVMGDTPPIFAQAAGTPVVYVADQPPSKDTGRALIVPKNSPIHSLADLRGKRIAVQKGSGTHSFLIQALQGAGVPYNAVKVVYLAPADARAAFASGAVDAWAIWDPFLAVAQHQMEAREIANGAVARTDGGFYVATRDFATQHPEWIRTILEESGKSSAWIAAKPHEAAELLAPALGVDVDILDEVESRSQSGVNGIGYAPITDALWDTQQTVADNFLKVGLLPAHVNVRDGALTPQQYAALTPQHPPSALSLNVKHAP